MGCPFPEPSNALCISRANASTDPNSAPVCRSAKTTPSRLTTRAVSASVAASKLWMYCFNVVLPEARVSSVEA